METLTINKDALTDLVKLSNELNDRIESIELMNNPEVMASHKKAKEEIEKRKFADWNEL